LTVCRIIGHWLTDITDPYNTNRGEPRWGFFSVLTLGEGEREDKKGALPPGIVQQPRLPKGWLFFVGGTIRWS